MERLPEFIANHLFLCSLLIALIMLLIWNLLGESLSGVKSVSPAEATRLINKDDAIVIDIRSQKEFETGHILNAENYPVSELEQQKGKLEKHKQKPMIIYCQHGQESARISRTFKQLGFDNVCSLQGGITAWTGANLPVLKGNT